MDKSYSPAYKRNWKPILNILQKVIIKKHKKLLEVGSGTGQHATYIASYFLEMPANNRILIFQEYNNML